MLVVAVRTRQNKDRGGFRGQSSKLTAHVVPLQDLVLGVLHARVTLAIDKAVLQQTKVRNRKESASLCITPVRRL
jgi:hypothetical protein